MTHRLALPRAASAARTLLAGAAALALLAGPAAGARPDAVLPDGATYHGQLRDGRLHGKGRLAWANGAWYEGAFERGLFEGAGQHRTSAGALYRGSFRRGLMDGPGRLAGADGAVYVGQFARNEFNGVGRKTVPGRGVYAGQFRDGQYHGLGQWSGADERYAGQFRRGRPHGKGVMRYNAGGMFAGEFADGVFHGGGRYEKADGQTFVGQFVRGAFTGQGEYRGVDGMRHTGLFVDWTPHGRGKLVDGRGDSYEGLFEQGEPGGRMRYAGRDGSVYTGAIKYGKFDGHGVLRWPNGDRYTGNFEFGLPEGEGVMRYAKARADGSTERKGLWRNGEPADPGDQDRAGAAVETAIYTQRALLDKALAALLPERPGAIDMYLMAVGGDGAQEVFRRETDFVRAQFERDYGTAGRSLVLVNSRNTLATAPLATVAGIGEGLAALGARMDRDNDILFLFLTSHGSPGHELALQPPGVAVRQLAAAELGRQLRESGIRWKVVLVSACYAGGFIDHLKDEHTLVITAARRDRTSFGCADQNDFTYFGRAFFKEALPHSASFTEAFEKARALVRKWEADDAMGDRGGGGGVGGGGDGNKGKGGGKGGGKVARGAPAKVEHSEPQMHQGALVGKQLAAWRAQLAAGAK
ncbi:C13 family peptidase [Massilia glaciei]|uniref:Peptidase C13 n=1 Tax=Massilia glaciei TaxID=1524097 RepID=A0A2U2I6C0_9BURK|nr:C13 family peptidase [Massilia glaciei]PWF55308.1 peptidase C13 [Massilia glaciei]